MTNKEAINELKELKEDYWDDDGYGHETKQYDDTMAALDMAISALEQQPCEDAISRSSLLEKLDDCYKEKVKIAPDNMAEGFAQVEKLIKQEPPVTPQEPKTGHWIEGQTDNPNIHNILCSCCFEGYPSKGHANSQYTKEKFQWCPKCGARMVEP